MGFLQGLQKLTLLDYPGKLACTVFTRGCDLRCPFCHNASLVLGTDEPPLADGEFFAFLEKRKGVLDGVCVTGGEPLLHPDIGDFLKKIKDMGFSVKLDTNGTYPELLAALISAGLVDYVAMDIKSSPDTYDRLCGTHVDIEAVKRSVALLGSSGIPHEFRTTAVASLHTAEDFAAIAKWLGKDEKYFIQAFTDSGDLIEDGNTGFTKEELKNLLALVKRDIPGAELRGV